MNILLVDDNVDITTMLDIYFTKQGHKCTVSNLGHNSLLIMQNQKFDIILLDIAMPDFSGADIINHLSQTNRISDLNIIVVTASAVSFEQNQEFIKSGVKAVLKKPIDPDDLLKYMQQFL